MDIYWENSFCDTLWTQAIQSNSITGFVIKKNEKKKEKTLNPEKGHQQNVEKEKESTLGSFSSTKHWMHAMDDFI